MQEVKDLVLNYFQVTENYFWHWAENGTVIEWSGGVTICYREDLSLLLGQLMPHGVPPLAPVLLVLDACRDNWTSYLEKDPNNGISLYRNIIKGLTVEPEKIIELLDKLDRVFAFLNCVHTLPGEYRSGSKRLLLLEAIFAGTKDLIPEREFKPILFSFEKGEYDTQLFTVPRPLNSYIVQNHIDFLSEALTRFPDTKTLELKIRTGLQKIPTPAQVSLQEDETSKGNLLDNLENDPQTGGLIRLTRQVMTVLRAPIRSVSSDDQIFGGVADISNRGNFDRLLLSELANDDVVLMARLANNEALYLRREELPDKTERERIVLVDVTIKMWGLPKIFAFASALACTQLNTQNISMKVYALSGTTYVPLDFTSVNGVITALESIDASIHCGRALGEFMAREKKSIHAEYYLVTNELNFSYPDFQYYFSKHKTNLDYLVKVNRQGQLTFSQLTEGVQKIVCTATYDLNVLLEDHGVVLQKRYNTNFPAFMQLEPPPLLFPTSKTRLSVNSTFDMGQQGLVSVSTDNRLLYWSAKNKGALEWMDSIEEGKYYFGVIGTKISILVSNDAKDVLKLYCINKDTNLVSVYDYKQEIGKVHNAIYFRGEYHIINGEYKYMTIEVNKDPVSLSQESSKEKMENAKKLVLVNKPDYYTLKKFINNGYSVIAKARSIYISQTDEIVIDGHRLIIENDTSLKIQDKPVDRYVKHASRVEYEYSLEGFGNTKIKFSKFIWPNGSEMILDSRGMLHLKSSDRSIPETTIVLVLNQPSACWAADNARCGNAYFTGVDPYRTMKVPEFYEKYIHRFIKKLS